MENRSVISVASRQCSDCLRSMPYEHDTRGRGFTCVYVCHEIYTVSGSYKLHKISILSVYQLFLIPNLTFLLNLLTTSGAMLRKSKTKAKVARFMLCLHRCYARTCVATPLDLWHALLITYSRWRMRDVQYDYASSLPKFIKIHLVVLEKNLEMWKADGLTNRAVWEKLTQVFVWSVFKAWEECILVGLSSICLF